MCQTQTYDVLSAKSFALPGPIEIKLALEYQHWRLQEARRAVPIVLACLHCILLHLGCLEDPKER